MCVCAEKMIFKNLLGIVLRTSDLRKREHSKTFPFEFILLQDW